MGKASKWFRGLLGLKKSDHSSPSQPPATSRSHPSPNPPKKKWGFGKSSRDKDHQNAALEAGERAPGDDPEKHAIAVAAASAAVAEAAVAAAQAAAAVVRLTNSGRSMTSGIAGGNNHTVAYGSGNRGLVIREQWAAVKIQSHFRAHLARKALRALKSLVRLQALVRGHILRKQTGERLRQLQAISRAQARARALRAHNSDLQYSNFKSTQFHSHGPVTPEKFEHILRAKSMKHDQSSMLKKSGSRSSDQDRVRSVWSGSGHRTDDDEKSDKILEIDSGNNKPYFLQKRRNLFQSCHLSLSSDLSSSEVNSYPTPLKSARDIEDETEEETLYGTANNSPRFGSFTPAKSDGSRNGYPDFPNYMSYTESARAKMRSMSAPRQRPAPVQSEGSSVSGSIKRYSVHANFTSKAYPGSGRLDRLGMPVVGGGDAVGFSGGGNWMRY